MSDDMFSVDFSKLNLKDLIAVLNELDSKVTNEITPDVVDEAGETLLQEERRILNAKPYKKNKSRVLPTLLTKEVIKNGKVYKAKAGYTTEAIRSHPETVITEFGKPGKKGRKKGGKDSKGRKIGAVQSYSHIRAAVINKKDEIYENAKRRFEEAIEKEWSKKNG